VNTIIISNKISTSQGEGILLINSDNCWIIRNQIYDNYHGMVAINSAPKMELNVIKDNKGNGIILVNSKPHIIGF